MSTSLSYIDPTATSGLIKILTSAENVLSTATANAPLYTASEQVRGASDSLNIISAQLVLSTATDDAARASATAVIEAALDDLQELSDLENMYLEDLVLWPNLTFTIVFGVLFVLHMLLAGWSGYYYFGLIFFCGCGLTLAGYLARCFSVGHEDQESPFLCQFVCLTISPAFIMAGIYYMLGRMLKLHGDNFSVLKPRWFSYIFVTCDLVSLVVQAVGGIMAAIGVTQKTGTTDGTNVMVGGIAFQVVSMTMFETALLEFCYKIYFRNSPEVKFSLLNFFALVFDTKRGKQMRVLLEPNYVANYQSIRANRLFPYIPLALFVATAFIYVRCIYRLVELAGGWSGYVITHEAFLFGLDATQVMLCCITMALFHPSFVWGKRHTVKHLDRQISDVDLENPISMEKIGNFQSEDIVQTSSQRLECISDFELTELIIVEEQLDNSLSYQLTTQLSEAQSPRI